jgi:type IV pilus assembly protein PilF
MLRINLIWLILFSLSACVVVDEGPTQKEKASDINVQLGMGYYRQNNLELANQKLIKALDQNPRNAQAHHAYAVLQNRFNDKEKAEFHFRKAIEYNDKDSEALNNFGAFLCNDNRPEEAEKMFLQALKNPLYKTPEVAYTNAASCLQRNNIKPLKVKQYLKKALGLRTNSRPALIMLAEISFDEKQYQLTTIYLKRYHLVGKPTARSLWLEIRNELELKNRDEAYRLAEKLKADFSDTPEYQSWLKLSK